MNRKQKIDLLKGIANGSKSIHHLSDRYEFWLSEDGETFSNNSNCEKIIKTKSELEAYQKSMKGVVRFINIIPID